MKDEIKEILDILKNKENFTVGQGDYEITLYKYQIDLLLNNMTNLQQKLEYYENIDPDKTIDKFRQKINKEMFDLQEENKTLKHNLEQMYNDTKDTYNEICAEQIDYKSRNKKAIEYIKEHTLYSVDLYDKDDVSSYFEKASPKDLLNILQGSDKDES